MAWIVQTSLQEIDSPQFEMAADDQQMLRDIGAEIAKEKSQLSVDDPDFFFKSQRMAFQYGYRYPEVGHPIRIKIKKMVGSLPDFLGYVVTHKVKDYIEGVEPGVHHFMPVEVTMPDGSLGEPRYLLNVCSRINSVLLEQSPGVCLRKHPSFPELTIFGCAFDKNTQITLDKTLIEGRAIWYEFKLRENFISDEFHTFIKDNGLRGFEISPFGFQRAEEA